MPQVAAHGETGVRLLVHSELQAVRRGDGPARTASVALVVIGAAMVAVGRLRDGALAPDQTLAVVAGTTALGLPLVLLLLGPIRYLHRVESGVETARRLAAIPAARRRLAPLADCLWLLAAVLLVALMAFVVGSGGTAGASAAVPRLVGIMLNAAIGGAALTLLAVALACVSRSITSYLLAAVSVLGVGLSLIWAASWGGVFAVLYAVWPTRAIPRLVNPQYAGDWGAAVVVATVASACAAAVIWWAPDVDGSPPRRSIGRTQGARVSRVPLWTAAAVCWGLAGPSLLAQYLPWYARPDWIAQVSTGRSSPDVAARWVTAVQSGTTTPGTLAVAAPAVLAGPLLPVVLRLRADTAAVEYSADVDPGTVTVQAVRGEAVTGLIYVCLEPRDATWIVTGVRSAPDCPGTRP